MGCRHTRRSTETPSTRRANVARCWLLMLRPSWRRCRVTTLSEAAGPCSASTMASMARRSRSRSAAPGTAPPGSAPTGGAPLGRARRKRRCGSCRLAARPTVARCTAITLPGAAGANSSVRPGSSRSSAAIRRAAAARGALVVVAGCPRTAPGVQPPRPASCLPRNLPLALGIPEESVSQPQFVQNFTQLELLNAFRNCVANSVSARPMPTAAGARGAQFGRAPKTPQVGGDVHSQRPRVPDGSVLRALATLHGTATLRLPSPCCAKHALTAPRRPWRRRSRRPRRAARAGARLSRAGLAARCRGRRCSRRSAR